MSGTTLGPLELSVLLAVARLGDEAYGLAVRREVSQRLDHNYSVGAVYTTLARLEEKGFVTARTAEPRPTRGGRSRRQFRVTASGRRALLQAKQIAASLWHGIGSRFLPEAT